MRPVFVRGERPVVDDNEMVSFRYYETLALEEMYGSKYIVTSHFTLTGTLPRRYQQDHIHMR